MINRVPEWSFSAYTKRRLGPSLSPLGRDSQCIIIEFQRQDIFLQQFTLPQLQHSGADMVSAPPPWPLPQTKQGKVCFLINGWLSYMALAPAPHALKLRWQSSRLFMEINCKTQPIRPALFSTTQLFTPNKSGPRSDLHTQTLQQINVKLVACQLLGFFRL